MFQQYFPEKPIRIAERIRGILILQLQFASMLDRLQITILQICVKVKNAFLQIQINRHQYFINASFP